jgi:hypothetical protein
MNNKNGICKIDMYKNAIYKFVDLNKYELQLSDEYQQVISIHIGILFLTELNRYNKKQILQFMVIILHMDLLNYFLMLFLTIKISIRKVVVLQALGLY